MMKIFEIKTDFNFRRNDSFLLLKSYLSATIEIVTQRIRKKMKGSRYLGSTILTVAGLHQAIIMNVNAIKKTSNIKNIRPRLPFMTGLGLNVSYLSVCKDWCRTLKH